VCSASGAERHVDFATLQGGETATIAIDGTLACATPAGTVSKSTLAVTTATEETALDNNEAVVEFVAINPPPTILHAKPSRTTLWPDNGKLVPVEIRYDVHDNCGKPRCTLSVSSDEPAHGHAPDWAVFGPHHVEIRAETSRHGDGRTYDETITCMDSGGGSSSQSVQVNVPRAHR
jgi:hypothetical protein